VDFGPPTNKRPAVIVQNDIGNKYAPTVIVATITSVRALDEYPTDVLIPDGVLPKKNSRVLGATILTIDKDALGDFVTRLPDEIMEKVDSALIISLDLAGGQENLEGFSS
jgi:mRNA interferase MazF